MTSQEIIDYFQGNPVYKFTGKMIELQQLQEECGGSFNCLIVHDIVYFTTQIPATDGRITIFSGN
jgi:hypothetical protein